MDVRAYLDRIDHRGEVERSPAGLEALVKSHIYSVPFENFDIHLGIPITLDYEAAFEKIVHRRRGGFCYELNGLFGHLLAALGFEVSYLSARVARGTGFDPDFGHMALRVIAGGDAYLVDVGFGSGLRAPMRLEPGQVQYEARNEYRLEARDGLLSLEIQGGSGYRGGYRFENRPRRLSDFAAMCRYHQMSPLSPFTQKRLCTLPQPYGRITLTEMTLIRTVEGARHTTPIGSNKDYRWVLLNTFGIELPRIPENRGERWGDRLYRNVATWQRRTRKAWALVMGGQ